MNNQRTKENLIIPKAWFGRALQRITGLKFHMCWLFVIGLLLSACNFPSEQVDTFERRISFNENWSFRLGDSLSQESEAAWRTLDLPHDWSIEGEFSQDHPASPGGGALPGGTGWYKKRFKLEPVDSTKVISILFDGIYHNSEVWINGEYLGNRPFGYIGFQYDLTPHLSYGSEENELLVKVNNDDQPNSRWYSGSGIYRNVWMNKTDKLHVAKWGTFITTPEVSADSALVNLEVKVNNQYPRSKQAVLSTKILKGNHEITTFETDFSVASGNQTQINQQTVINTPALWSVEKPELYTAVTEIIIDQQVVDRYETTFGIRSFRFDNQEGFILNGEPVKIKGVCLHHDLGPLGAAVNTRAIERQLEIMKEMGVNGIRTAHNPPAPELLDLCDQMGFIVMDESFDMWEQSKTENDYSKHFEQWHERDHSDMILRDRNHPSIFIWSIGNEIPEQWSDRGAEIAKNLAELTRSLDSTRPLTAAMNPPNQGNAIATSGVLDLIGYNYAHESYEDHPEVFPNTPFIAAETTSALATRGYYEFPSDTTKIWPVSWDQVFTGGNKDNTVSAFDQVRTPWGSTHQATWKIIKKHDYLSGFFIWTGFDYLGEPTPYTWPSRSSYFGIVDLAGFPKDVYYMYKSEWTDKPVLHLLPHWNWEEGQVVDVWAYYNKADEVELFLNGESQGVQKKEGDELHVMWRLPFQPGTLRAVSRKDGEVVLEKEVKTAKAPAVLELTADREQLHADGKDLSYITVNIRDQEGVLVPTADNEIFFSLKGNGQIVGVASGDPTSHESFKGNSHSAMAGKCLVIVQAGKQGGTLELTASSAGLENARINLTMD